MVSAKFLDDKRLSNQYFAKIGGISPAEIHLMELELVKTIGFNLFVERQEFESYAEEILALR